MPVNDDTYSLISWLQEMALDAHNKAHSEPLSTISRWRFAILAIFAPMELETARHEEYCGMERAFNKVIEKIRSNGVNQRPHVKMER